MNYQEAAKKVNAEKPKDNYLVIEFSFDEKLVLSSKDGIAIIAALANAEKFTNHYNEGDKITPLPQGAITTRSLSHKEYIKIKIAGLLGVKVSELVENEKE
jgi:hypothetical protein